MEKEVADKKKSFAVKGAVFALLAAVLFQLTLQAQRLEAADWPMFRGNAARTGFSAEQAAPPLVPAWTFQAGGGVLSSPAVYEGIIYFGAKDGRIYALNARTGEQLWSYHTGNWVDSSPCVSSGAVYAASLDGYLYALDRLSGALLWASPLGARSVSSPLVSGGRVFAGTGLPEKKLKVFDAFSGAQLGSFQALQPVDSAPAAYGENVYFGASDGWIYALDRSTLLPPAGWLHYPTAGSFRMNAVALSGGDVYALPGHDDKRGYALDAAAGTELRRSAPVEDIRSWQTFTSPVIAGARAYFSGGIGAPDEYSAAGDNYLSAVDTGSLVSVWASSPSLGPISGLGLLSSPAMAGEFLYSGTVDSRLLVISSSGVQAQALALSSAAYSSPAVANGMVYIGDMSGKLQAFSAGRAAAVSAPAPGSIVNGTVSVRGYISNPSLAGYTLEYSSGGSPQVWHNIISSVAAAGVDGGILASWDTSALANGLYALKLTVLESGPSVYDNSASLELRVNSVPQAPSGLAAADVPGDTGNRIALSWNASPTAGISQYRVYRDAGLGRGFELLASTAPSPLAFTDAAAATGSTFVYTVRAYDGYLESSDSGQASAVSVNDTGDNTPPAAVTDLLAEPGAVPGTITLSWTAPGNDGNIGTASHFVILSTTSAGYNWAGYSWAGFEGAGLSSATRLAEGPAGDNISYDAPRLRGGVTYYFALQASDFVPNVGGLSNIATAYAAVDKVPPQPPSGLLAEDTPGDEGGSLTLSWDLSPDDGAGAGDVYGYKIYRRLLDSSYISSAPYAETAAGVSSYRDRAASLHLRYYYAAAAFDSTLDSGLSAEASGVSADNYKFVDAGQGGSLRLPDGARVDIPGGAASQNDGLLFVKLNAATYEPLASINAAPAANPTGIVYAIKFRSSYTRLTGKALVSLPYTDSEVAGMETENLRIYSLSNGGWTMVDTSSPDAQAKKVSAEVIRFSTFTIMEYLPSGELFSGDEVYTYPNPAKGETVTFKLRLSDKAFVKVDVYNVAGEQVASLEKANCPAGQTSELVWITKNIASGVYVYRVRAESASGSKAIIKKLAVIH